MSERIVQLGFDIQSQEVVSHDVTPPGFIGFTYPEPKISVSPTLGRFVREAATKTHFNSASEVYDYLRDHVFNPWEKFTQEELWILMLNSKNVVTHEAMVYRGTPNTMYVWKPDVFREAIRVNAVALILAHNHPSNDPTPSPEDVAVTQQLVEAAKLLQMLIHDHIIVGSDHFVSLGERGIKMC